MMTDDVVGEVPDKRVKATGSFHFGGLATDKSVKEGDLKVPWPVWFYADGHDHLPLGSKILPSHMSCDVAVNDFGPTENNKVLSRVLS